MRIRVREGVAGYRPSAHDVTASVGIGCRGVCVGVPTVTKGLPSSGLSFYRFPVASDRRSEKENWQHERSWVCSAHFMSGKKSEDPLSPDY